MNMKSSPQLDLATDLPTASNEALQEEFIAEAVEVALGSLVYRVLIDKCLNAKHDKARHFKFEQGLFVAVVDQALAPKETPFELPGLPPRYSSGKVQMPNGGWTQFFRTLLTPAARAVVAMNSQVLATCPTGSDLGILQPPSHSSWTDGETIASNALELEAATFAAMLHQLNQIEGYLVSCCEKNAKLRGAVENTTLRLRRLFDEVTKQKLDVDEATALIASGVADALGLFGIPTSRAKKLRYAIAGRIQEIVGLPGMPLDSTDEHRIGRVSRAIRRYRKRIALENRPRCNQASTPLPECVTGNGFLSSEGL